MRKAFFLTLFTLLLSSFSLQAQNRVNLGVELAVGYQTGDSWYGPCLLPQARVGYGPVTLLLGYLVPDDPWGMFWGFRNVQEFQGGLRLGLPLRESRFKFVAQYSFRMSKFEMQDLNLHKPSGPWEEYIAQYHSFGVGFHVNLIWGIYLSGLINTGSVKPNKPGPSGFSSAHAGLGWRIDL